MSYWWVGKISAGLFLIGNLYYFELHRWTTLGQSIVGLGALIHLSHYIILKRASKKLDPPDSLVTNGGLFPWIRHPMYLGDAVVMSGLLLLRPTRVSAIVLLIGLVCLWGQRGWEDRQLEKLFGDEYRSYRGRTWC